MDIEENSIKRISVFVITLLSNGYPHFPLLSTFSGLLPVIPFTYRSRGRKRLYFHKATLIKDAKPLQ